MGITVLVTGGAGFIGSHLVDLLIENNFRVVVVDDLSSGREENVNREAQFYKLNITEEKKLREVFQRERPDYVSHQAAQISVAFSVREPLFDARTNILGSVNLLQCSVDYLTRGIVFASSGGTVYGEPEHLPVKESHPLQPLSPYGISKVAVEHYLNFYQNHYSLNYVSLRYGNVYGPRQDPYGEAGVIAIFIEKMLRGEAPTINGDGEYIRDYIYVKDVAQANLLAIQNMLKLTKLKPQTEGVRERRAGEGSKFVINNSFNLGTGKGTSVNELFHLLQEIIKFPYPVHYGPPREGDLRKNILDNRLIKEGWGWQPEVALSTGLKETVAWFANKKGLNLN